MPDINATLGSTWSFQQNLEACQEPTVVLDFKDDYLIFDHQVEADYTQEGERVLGRDGRIQPSDVRQVHLCHVGRYKVTFRDLLSESSGHLKVGDIRAEISEKELDGVEPRTGDKLVLTGETYHVFAVDNDRMTGMRIVWCRK